MTEPLPLFHDKAQAHLKEDISVITKFSEYVAKCVEESLGLPIAHPDDWVSRKDYENGFVSFTHRTPAGSMGAQAVVRDLQEALDAVHKGLVDVGCRMANSETAEITLNFKRDAVESAFGASESIYSDGKSSLVSLTNGNRKLVVNDDGEAVEVDDPDKYVRNLNKTAGTRYAKTSEAIEKLQASVDEANDALRGTPSRVTMIEKENALGEKCYALKAVGKSEVLKEACALLPVQEGFEDDSFGNGYDEESDSLNYDIPVDTDLALSSIQDFLDNFVILVLDDEESNDEAPGVEDWVEKIAGLEPDPIVATKAQYAETDYGEMDDDELAEFAAAVSPEGDKAVAIVLTPRLGPAMAESIAKKVCARRPKVEAAPKAAYQRTDEERLLDRHHQQCESRVTVEKSPVGTWLGRILG